MVSKIYRYLYANRSEVWEELLRADRQTVRGSYCFVAVELTTFTFYASGCNVGFFLVLTPYFFFKQTL